MCDFLKRFCFFNVCIVIGSLFLSLHVKAQETSVSGKVTSLEHGTPLPGVSIIITGTTAGTISDLDGNFRINVARGSSLTFSSVGFISQTIDIGDRSVLDVVMVPDIKTLSEIVVIGYGTRERKDLTGAISDMESDEIERAVVLSPENAMQGRLAGVLVTNSNGLVNSRPDVQIRGINTFGVANPLYVIDGVPVTEYGTGYDEPAPFVNILTLINPADVESISVLKDASAAAIYGVRASNGVILITTKQGKKNQQPKIDLNLSYGVSNIPKTFDVLGVSDYVALYTESYGAHPDFSLPGVFNPDSANAESRYDRYLGDKPFIDWQEPYLNKNAGFADASVKVYGGSENTDYYMSFGYTGNEGNYVGNDLERYSFAANLNTRAVKWLEIGVNYRLGYVETLDMYRSTSYSLGSALDVPAWQPIYLDDDFYNDNEESDLKYGFANVVDTVQTPNPLHPQWGGTDRTQPLYIVEPAKKYGEATRSNYRALYHTENGPPYLKYIDYKTIRNIGNAYILVEPVKGLTLKGSLALDWYTTRNDNWNNVDNVMYTPQGENPWEVGDGTSKGAYSQSRNENFNRVAELTIGWIKRFGDHNLNVTMNAMDQLYSYDGILGGSEQQNSEDPDRWTLGGPLEYTSNSSTYVRYALQGYMGRLSYNYASKYYVDATVRYDGSSRFAPGYRWGTFPSFAVAWRLTAENFMSSMGFLNDLKIRAGWGQLGNQETRPYAYLSSVNVNPVISRGSGGGDFAGEQYWGISLPDFPTEDLTWETTTTLNVGFDAVFWKNRFNLTVEYYDKLTEGILQAVELPTSVGNLNPPILNVANVSNKGWEFQLGYHQRFGNVGVYLNGNFTTVDNRVEKVWNDQRFYAYLGTDNIMIEEGYPLFYLYGWQVDGIFQNEKEVQSWWSVKSDQQADSSLVSPGDMYFKDINGPPDSLGVYKFYTPVPDSTVDSNDRTYIGNTIAGYFYGFTLGADWKGFDISIFFQGVGDIQKYNQTYAHGTNFSGNGSNRLINALDRWTPDNKVQWDASSNESKARAITRAVYGDPAGNYRFSDRYVMDAGYLRLKNLTVGYTLPAGVMNRTNTIERVRFYFSGQNLLTFTKWVGLDPEVENQYLPLPRTWVFGINATF
jgi:TonB-linked SusC/RagA family outer membrane protein